MDVWVFRADPRELAAEELLAGNYAQKRLISWPVRQHRDYVEEGDLVYIWYSDPLGDGAIVAEATVARPIKMRTPSPAERSMFRDLEPGPRVELAINDLRLTPGGGRIPKVLLMSHPRLKLLPFLRWDEWYDWPLNESEARDLGYLWEAAKPSRVRML